MPRALKKPSDILKSLRSNKESTRNSPNETGSVRSTRSEKTTRSDQSHKRINVQKMKAMKTAQMTNQPIAR